MMAQSSSLSSGSASPASGWSRTSGPHSSIIAAAPSAPRSTSDAWRSSGAQLRTVPEVIAVAGGIEKTEAIRAALLGGWVNTLITDGDAARALCS